MCEVLGRFQLGAGRKPLSKDFPRTMLTAVASFLFTNLSTLLAGSVVFLLATFILSKKRKPANYPPGPTGVPLYGNLLEIKRANVNGPGILDKWADQYGKVYSLRFGPYDVVVLNSAEAIREAFLKNGNSTSGRYTNILYYRLVYGKTGIIMNEGQEWKEVRRTSLHALRDFGMGKKSLEKRIQEEAMALIDVIDMKNEAPFDPHPMLHNAFSNIICSVLFGDRYEYGDPEFQVTANELNVFFSGVGAGNIESFVPILTPLIPLKPRTFKVMKSVGNLRKHIQQKINKYKEKFDPENIQCFVDIYLLASLRGELTGKAKSCLLETMFDLFLAGSETATTSLRWGILYLTNYPAVQDKCQRLIREAIGQARLPTNADRSQLLYIEATINEIQRISSIVGTGVLHRAVEEVTVCGYTIPKDTLLISNLHHLHMETEYWGDPQTFRPERWLTDDGNQLIKHDNYLPFSTGPRECMGKSLAMQEMFIILVSLLQKFTFRPKDPDNLPKFAGKMGITHSPNGYEIIASKI